MYALSGRRPSASINFITAPDGFTLADLVAYDHKHNEANGEDNRDGESHNRSWNSGVEGSSDDQAVLATREARRRSLLATLFLSQGVPMLSGGDEIGRTQGGNNNGYAQDNEVCWYDWGAVDEPFLEFTKRLIALRSEHPVFRRRRWFEGRAIRGADVHDLMWFAPDGTEMSDDDWAVGYASSLAVFLNGEAISASGPRGEPVRDDSFLLLFNANSEPIKFGIPADLAASGWIIELESSPRPHQGQQLPTSGRYEVDAWGLTVLRCLP